MLFKEEVLSDTEIQLVKISLAEPHMQKYLQILAKNTAYEIAEAPIMPEDSPEVFIRKQIHLKGALDLLDTLLNL
jgi:hypothetical protein